MGFLGPKFWKISQLSFNFKAIQNDFNNPVVNIDMLNKFYSNKNYLSSDQFENKKVVFGWSQTILNYVKNDVPIPRMFFPYIPKNINQYKTNKKKVIFKAILLPIALRGNELVLEERKLMKIAFSTNNIYQIELFSKKYKVKNFKKINFSNLNIFTYWFKFWFIDCRCIIYDKTLNYKFGKYFDAIFNDVGTMC